MRFWKEQLADVVLLGALPADTAAAIIEDRVQAPVDARTHRTIVQGEWRASARADPDWWTRGVRDGTFMDVGGVLTSHGDLRAGPALSELLQTRIDRLPRAGKAQGAELLAEAAAFTMPIDIASTVCDAASDGAVLRGRDARRSPTPNSRLPSSSRTRCTARCSPTGCTPNTCARSSCLWSKPATAPTPHDAEDSVRAAGWLVKLGDRSQPTMILAAARRAFDHSDLTLAAHLARAAADQVPGSPADLLLRRIDAILLGEAATTPSRPQQPVAIEQEALSAHDRFVVGGTTGHGGDRASSTTRSTASTTRETPTRWPRCN